MSRDLPKDLPDSVAWVAVDTETSGLHPDDGARVACVSVTFPSEGPGAVDGLETHAYPFDQGVRDKLPTVQLSLLDGGEDPNLGAQEWNDLLGWCRRQKLVFHNAKFDLTMMRAGTRHFEGRDLGGALHWDTMLAQRELDPIHAAGLDATGKRLGLAGKQGLPALKEWLQRHKFGAYEYDKAPWELVEPYVAADTELTAKLFRHQMQRAAKDPEVKASLQKHMRLEVDLLLALYRMEQRGIAYDAEKSLAAAEYLETRAKEVEDGMPFSATPAGAKSYFVDHLGLPVDRKSEKTGKPSIDEEQIRAWVKQGKPHAAEYAEVTKARRAASMWYRGYPEKMGADGRLRTTFRQGHVKSGRMSVERVQLQAMPKSDKNIDGIPGVRSLMQAKAGHGLWSLDLSQAELRVAARYSGCKLMLELLSQGVDMHGKTCQEVMHVSPDAPDWKLKRDIAKRLTFGGIFMVGGKTFQGTLSKLADIHLPVAECMQLVQGWRNLYPEIQDAYNEAERHVIQHSNVVLLRDTEWATPSWFGPRDWTRTAWNRTVQGSLAEAFKQLLVGVDQKWPGYGVLTVHDSVVIEAPVDEGEQVAQEIADWAGPLMTSLFDIEMKMDVERYDVTEAAVAA